MTRKQDVIVIGAGHNGLVCANYLARAGLNVVVLESRDSAGGMAASSTLGNDYHFPGLAHVGYPLDRKLRSDLRLDSFGYKAGAAMDTLSLGSDGNHVRIGASEVSGVSNTDAAAYTDFKKQYRDFLGALQPLMMNRPPRLKHMDFTDKTTLAKLGWKVRMGLGRESMYEFLRVVAMNMYDILDETFENKQLKGALALDSVMGSGMGPRTPGTVLTWLQRLQGEQNGDQCSLAATQVINALTQSAEDAGVEIQYDAPVAKILIDNDKAFGVELENGDMVKAPRVVSGIDPRITFGKLVGAPRLDTMFATRARQVRGKGVVGKLNIALSGLPEFNGVDSSDLGHRLVVAPAMRYVERAFNHCKYKEPSDNPIFEVSIPSVHDASLAPDGHHVMSVNVAFLPYDIEGGWGEQKKTLAYRLISQLGDYAPNLKSLIVDHEFLSPADIESDFGADQGHWHHGEMSIHQSFMMRPVHGAAQYNTPVDNLFLCSAGSHPGGGVTGLPGRNAAKRILGMGGAK